MQNKLVIIIITALVTTLVILALLYFQNPALFQGAVQTHVPCPEDCYCQDRQGNSYPNTYGFCLAGEECVCMMFQGEDIEESRPGIRSFDEQTMRFEENLEDEPYVAEPIGDK